ncbi:nuclease-related domain-containing protein [Mycoplasma sp. OR1901]|uniref:nuclease-related domain-containing protein n=1 Tax=Mycoplasma sp. OR1901 TaxID=2742195 RepID=UPI001583219F|nr:nuclease-related domain-containing protein [Mycoplasma sp. OR1901]QKT05552.1 NERD domain-containing protein [Mycoplasma sp. OR1901]
MNEYPHYVLSIFFIVLFGVIILFSLGYYIFWKYFIDYKKNKQGFLFENWINKKIKKIVDKKTFIFSEGGIYSYDNKKYELDGFLVSDSMIVVCEYKLYNGILSGNARNEKIFLSLGKKRKIKVKNPIFQNENNIKHVLKMLKKNIPYASLVVLPQNTKIEINDVPEHVLLVNVNNLEQTINKLIESSQTLPKIINNEDVKNLFNAMKIKTTSEKIKFKNMLKRKGK